MTQPRWSGEDDALMADIRQALAQSAPGSDAVLEAGRRAFTWRTVDEELAGLTYDSLLDDGALVRGAPGAARSLLFDAEDLSMEVDILPGRLVGQLVPGVPGEIVVESRTGDVARAAADDEGCFTIAVGTTTDPLLRLRCTTALGVVVTDWVSI